MGEEFYVAAEFALGPADSFGQRLQLAQVRRVESGNAAGFAELGAP